MSLSTKRVLLVIGGGIAAYKSLDLIRRIKERGAEVRVVMTEAAQHFVTPLAAGALAGGHVFTNLFSRTDEQDVGHIRLARDCDVIVVAPATANIMAKLAGGHAGDLASAVLLAARVPVLMAPAMNPAMWAHPATRRNRAVLEGDGIRFVGPERGEMAERNESGEGRMAEPAAIADAIERLLMSPQARRLAGTRVVVTSGPTHEPIDPVRFIANRSSGRQGHAIAGALARLGADVQLVSGPVAIPDPPGVATIHVETAREMRDAVEALLPADAAVMVAAVADWRVEARERKIKKGAAGPPSLALVENPDILAGIGHHPSFRPRLVVGFAAETDDLLANAQAKLARKGADLIVANDVSGGVMGAASNRVHLISKTGVEDWPEMRKEAVAGRLAERIADLLLAGSAEA